MRVQHKVFIKQERLSLVMCWENLGKFRVIGRDRETQARGLEAGRQGERRLRSHLGQAQALGLSETEMRNSLLPLML